MKYLFNIVLACSIVLSVFSCKQKVETVVVELPVVRASSLYNADSIYTYNKAYGTSHESLSKSYLEKAKEAEESNMQMAIYFAKRATTLLPIRENYIYLAGLLNKTEQTTELYELYSLLINQHSMKINGEFTSLYLFGQPDEDTFYEWMLLRIRLERALAGDVAYIAEEAGIKIADLKDRLLDDERFNLKPGTEEYKNIMLQFMTEAEIEEYIKSPDNFHNYIASIKDSSVIFELNEKDIQNFNYSSYSLEEEGFYSRSISDFYIHYLPEKQENADSWFEFDIKRKIKINDKVTAVLYAIDTSATACPAEMRHIYYKIVTYSQTGAIIASQQVAAQAGEEFSTLLFEGNKFVVTYYERTWKKPYNKNDFDNYLVNKEKMGERSYQINESGLFQATDELTDSESEPTEEM